MPAPVAALGLRRLAGPVTALAVAASAVAALAKVLGAVVAGDLAEQPTGRLVVQIALLLVGAAVLDTAGRVAFAGVCDRAEGVLRADLLDAAVRQPLPALEEQAVGEVLDRVDDDPRQLGNLARRIGWTTFGSLLGAVLAWVAAGLVWWPAWIAFPLTAAAVLAVARPLTAEVAARKLAEEAAWSEHAGQLEEAVAGRDDVRSSLAQPHVVAQYATRAAALMDRIRDTCRVSTTVGLRTGLLLHALLAVLVVVGALVVDGGGLGVAQLVSLWLLVSAFVGQLSQISQHLPEIQAGLGALTRIRSLMSAPSEPRGGAPLVAGPVDVEVRGLTFSYPGGFALRGIDLLVPAGTTCALVGRSGAGKSTLARLLSRAEEPPPGTVLVGGQDVASTSLDALRAGVGVVTQRTELLAATLEENITLFAELPRATVDAAVAALELEDWVAALPHGLATRIGTGGTTLSAGEEQLVAFARLLVREVSVVVLDEATARMDPQTEQLVTRASQRLLAGRTGLLIAHRLSTTRHCDAVAVLDAGRVVQHGPRAELASAPGPFRDLLAASGDEGRTATATALTRGRPGGAGPVEGRPDGSAAAEERGPGGVLLAEPDGASNRRVEAAETPLAPAAGPLVAAPGAHPAAATAAGSAPGAGTDAGAAEATAAASAEAEAATSADGRLRAGPSGLARAVATLLLTHRRWGLLGACGFLVSSLTGTFGAVTGWTWGLTVAGLETGDPRWAATALLVASLLAAPVAVALAFRVYPLWWTGITLRMRLAVLRGQTDQRRLARTPPGEVVGRALDSERLVLYTDRWMDVINGVVVVLITTLVSRSALAGAVVAAVLVLSALASTAGVPLAASSSRTSADARARFGGQLVSALECARSVKLAAATDTVQGHLRRVDARRVAAAVREHRVLAVLEGLPEVLVASGVVLTWAGHLSGRWDLATALLLTTALNGVGWFGQCAGAAITEAPAARGWLRATRALAGGGDLFGLPAGVDLVAGTAPAPLEPPRVPLRHLALRGVSAVHDDGTVGVEGVDLDVPAGSLVLLAGRVGSGKSSLLASLAGLVDHEGVIAWNGVDVADPELFLRPGQVSWVGQVPRVLSGSFSDNIVLGHRRELAGALDDARLGPDVKDAGGHHALVGHRGVRLSGGQVQRLALARALATEAELLVADDVSSALDARTELELWGALRRRGVTVIGSSSKRSALEVADAVVVLEQGRVVATGPWRELSGAWGHLAG